MKLRVIALCIAAVLAGCAGAQARERTLSAQLQKLKNDLLRHDSATLTLENWCADHHLADPARVYARRVRDAGKAIPDALRAQLRVDAAEPLAYRHVQLVCGEHVLSEADNWYVPGRLTPEMNRKLENSDEPFGKVVKPLAFQRQTLSSRVLWTPARHRDMPRELLRHTAVLYTSTRVPFSAVIETYQRGLFDSPP
jgi:hypothetical protein